jgi:hypothetical protein
MADVKGKLCLNAEDREDLIVKLGIIPEKVNGLPFRKIVRRKVFDRRRITLIKANNSAPNQGDKQELWKLCRYRPIHGDLVLIGWALRSTVNGDYYIFSDSEVW